MSEKDKGGESEGERVKKEKEQQGDREKDKEGEGDKERDKEKKKSKKEKHKHRSRSRSRSRSADRDKDKDRDRDHKHSKKSKRQRSRSKEKDKRGRSKSVERDRGKRGRSRSAERDREARGRSKSPLREREKEKRGRSRSASREKKRDNGRGDSDRKRARPEEKKEDEILQRLAASVSQRALQRDKTKEDLEKEQAEQKRAEEARLEEEMRIRRERVKAWQEAKRKMEADSQGPAPESDQAVTETGETPAENAGEENKQWTLEDDEEDDALDTMEGDNEDPEKESKLETHPLPTQDAEPSAVVKMEVEVPQSAPPPAPKSIANEGEDEDDVDPLDAFMASLLETDQITVQDLNGLDLSKALGKGASAKVKGWKIDIFGTNTISLEDIQAGRMGPTEDWESDMPDEVPMTPLELPDDKEETAEEREQREENEKREFLEALRRRHEEEEAQLAKQMEEEERKQKTEDALGRVFKGEGDVQEESEVISQKKSALEILEEQSKKKELKPVDHSQIEYLSFRKNLYIIPKQLAKLSEAEVAERRAELDIKVRGRECPPPVLTWEQCGLSDRTLSVIEKLGFKEPFPIQQQAIPAIMCGRDVIGVAKTGSGKTLAFLLPMFRHIQDQPPSREGEGPVGLVMAPARELAVQIFNEAKRFCKALGLRVACVYGGAGVADQIADLKRGADIVVCTPGRMIDILCMQAGKLVNLKRVTFVVCDEADRMFDMGFEPQIRMILQNIRPDRQCVLFSATFPKPIEKLAKNVLAAPVEIIVGGRAVASETITQYVELHDESDKFYRLLQLLGLWNEAGNVIIFVDKQEKCDSLFQDLLRHGYACLSLHGGKDQSDRDHTIFEFKTCIKTVLVATSVAGRGLDVPECVCVINYSCPNHQEDYVHRVGRTGRAGRKGTAYTFISPEEEMYAPMLTKCLTAAKQKVPEELEQLANSFKEKVQKGEAKWAGTGFGGRGFTFDESEKTESQKLADQQRRQYLIAEGIIDPSESNTIDDDDDDGPEMPSAVAAAAVAAAAAAGAAAVAGTGLGIPAAAGLPAATANALATAKAVAAALAAGASPDAVAAAASAPSPFIPFQTIPGQALTPAMMQNADLATRKQMAEAIARNIGKPQGGPDRSHFEEELEINDYPAIARRKVTHRDTIEGVIELTSVAIKQRGEYIEPGKKIELGKSKLRLVIEGSTEMEVRAAKTELLRILEEETLRTGAGSTFGRYSVV